MSATPYEQARIDRRADKKALTLKKSILTEDEKAQSASLGYVEVQSVRAADILKSTSLWLAENLARISNGKKVTRQDLDNGNGRGMMLRVGPGRRVAWVSYFKVHGHDVEPAGRVVAEGIIPEYKGTKR